MRLSFLRYISPLNAIRDLRRYLQTRKTYELVFMMVSLAVTSFVLFAFVKDSHVQTEYRPEIIYVQQWRADRTDAQIRAQQAIDKVKKDKEIDAYNARVDKMRAQFKAVDDKMNKWGL